MADFVEHGDFRVWFYGHGERGPVLLVQKWVVESRGWTAELELAKAAQPILRRFERGTARVSSPEPSELQEAHAAIDVARPELIAYAQRQAEQWRKTAGRLA